MERPNQPPKPECCPDERIGEVDLWYYRTERRQGSVHRGTSEPQVGPASCLSNSASKTENAGGDELRVTEPKTDGTEGGRGPEDLPGSKSVARPEGDACNRGGPELSRRTNYESQAGKEAQQQEARTEGVEGVGSAHSKQPQGQSP